MTSCTGVWSCSATLGALALTLLGLLSGCETPGWAARLDEAFTPNPRPAITHADEERQRKKYAATRDRDALFWLLHYRIDSGMSLADVSRVLGEEGSRESHDRWIKTNGGNYQVGDDVYAFGPDNEGHTLYLVFRDGHLVNFDPDEFRPRVRRNHDDDDDKARTRHDK